MTDYLACASTATGVPITECEVCGQRRAMQEIAQQIVDGEG